MSLADKIRALEGKYAAVCGAAASPGAEVRGDAFPTGWADVDATLGRGLHRGALHEWLGLARPIVASGKAPCSTRDGKQSTRQVWSPPVGIVVHLAWQVLETETDRASKWTVWIGRRCFPYPKVLVRAGGNDRRLLERSLFVSTRDPSDCLWSMDLALRSPAVGAVIADGHRFNMAATRRVQLLAKRFGACALLVRPPWERDELSAAQTRWLVQPEPRGAGRPTAPVSPRWSVKLLRCKGLPLGQGPDTWALEWDRAKGPIGVSAPMVGQACDPKATATSKALVG